MARLTDKEQVFVAEYVRCLNATEAARVAGYQYPNKIGPRKLVKVGIQELIQQYLAEVKNRGIAERQNRIDALNDRQRRMQQVIAERAVAEELQNVPGGKTGLITRDLKGIGKGEDFRVVEVFSVDTGLLKEMREHEKQAAIETGQWTEKQEVSVPDGIDVSLNGKINKVYGDGNGTTENPDD